MDPIDLFDAATQQDWYPTYDRMRTECPAYRMPDTNTWVLTRYDDVHRALRRPDRFPNGAGTKSLIGFAPARKYWDEHGWQKRTPLGTNPPVHRNYRALIDGFFDSAGAERARPAITETVHRLIDSWRGRTSIDYVAEFATPLPVEIITRIIGFAVSDIPQLRIWSTAWVMPFSMGLTDDEQMYVAEQGVAFQRYIHEIAEERRRTPADDVISHLVHCSFNDVETGQQRPLEAWEIINIVDHLYIGGNETTTFALSSGLWLMLREPGPFDRLRAEPDLVPELVEEALRLESPTQGLFKGNVEPCPVGNQVVPAGATVHLRYAAANRDPAMFANPDRLDLDRTNKRRHLAFASGEHICPGAELSRLEQVIAHRAVIERVQRLRLSHDNDFTHHPGFVLRALNRLNIEFDAVT